jgi:cell division protein FtsB
MKELYEENQKTVLEAESFRLACDLIAKNEEIESLRDEVQKLKEINHKLRNDFSKSLGFQDSISLGE